MQFHAVLDDFVNLGTFLGVLDIFQTLGVNCGRVGRRGRRMKDAYSIDPSLGIIEASIKFERDEVLLHVTFLIGVRSTSERIDYKVRPTAFLMVTWAFCLKNHFRLVDGVLG